jgi:hypothetical protein
MHFTDRALAALSPPGRGQKLYADDTLPGFGLRVGTHSKTFVLTTGAARRRITIGRYPIVSLSQARDNRFVACPLPGDAVIKGNSGDLSRRRGRDGELLRGQLTARPAVNPYGRFCTYYKTFTGRSDGELWSGA